jgi:hypothetical protein
MHRLNGLLALALASLTLTACAGSGGGRATREPIATEGSGVSCIWQNRVVNWENYGREAILVSTPSRHYLVELTRQCRGLDFDATLTFDTPTGRVCGNPGEFVVTRDERCRILRVSALQKEEYDRMSKAGEPPKQ